MLNSICMCRKLSLARNIKCDTCSGSGTKSGRRYTCEVSHVFQVLVLGQQMHGGGLLGILSFGRHALHFRTSIVVLFVKRTCNRDCVVRRWLLCLCKSGLSPCIYWVCAGVPWIRSAGDDEAARARHDATDSTALQRLPGNRHHCAQP